jgi:hypothetical protein
MLLAHLGQNKVAILLKDQETMERPSDIQGLIYIPFKTDLALPWRKERACCRFIRWKKSDAPPTSFQNRNGGFI